MQSDKPESINTGLERGAAVMRDAFDADAAEAEQRAPAGIVVAPETRAVLVAQLRAGAAKDLAEELLAQVQEAEVQLAHWRERALRAEAWRDGFEVGSGTAKPSRTEVERMLHRADALFERRERDR